MVYRCNGWRYHIKSNFWKKAMVILIHGFYLWVKIYIGDKQGAIILDLHYLALYDYLNTINLGKAGEIYVVDDKNNII